MFQETIFTSRSLDNPRRGIPHRGGERFEFDGPGNPRETRKSDASLYGRQSACGNHEELPSPGRTVVGDRFPLHGMPGEDIDVREAERTIDPRTVRRPVALARRDVEPQRSCPLALSDLPGLQRRAEFRSGVSRADPGVLQAVGTAESE